MRASQTRNDAALLVDYAARLARRSQGRHAVHIHLSGLRAHNRREHHVRIALNCFDPLIKKHNGEIFLLDNDDIVFVCKGASISEIDGIVLKLRVLFSEDPLARAAEDNERQPFCTWYDLEKDYEKFRAMAGRVHAASQQGGSGWWSGDAQDGAPVAETPSQPLDPQKLGQLEKALASMDVAGFVRRQPVCVITPERPPKPVFSERYVSIAELQNALVPDVDLTADRWLFQRLTVVLDQRILALLPKLEAGDENPTSININVPTLLSPEFLSFDAKIRAITKKTFIFELALVDVFADMASYMFARDFLHERNYRVCLDGLTSLTFPLIDRRQLGLDMLKILWTPDMNDGVQNERHAKLGEAVALAGPSRVILCRCDDEGAIAAGRSMGITMFQGRQVDGLLRGATLRAAS